MIDYSIEAFTDEGVIDVLFYRTIEWLLDELSSFKKLLLLLFVQQFCSDCDANVY